MDELDNLQLPNKKEPAVLLKEHRERHEEMKSKIISIKNNNFMSK